MLQISPRMTVLETGTWNVWCDVYEPVPVFRAIRIREKNLKFHERVIQLAFSRFALELMSK